MSTLTAKQAAFAREYIRDCNGSAAAKRAGYSEKASREMAVKLLAMPHVQAEVKRYQDELAKDAKVTAESLIAEAEEARQLAKLKEQAGAMVAATTLKAKLTGHLVEKTEDMAKREALELWKAKQGELQTAADLFATAAESLGLPRAATPAQVVGAIAERPIATPEAFRLMHAVAQAESDRGLL